MLNVLEYANQPFIDLFEVNPEEDFPPPGRINRFGVGRWLSDFVDHDSLEALNKVLLFF